MTANRGLVALVALAVLVWGVAFAGGATIAVLTANATVTTTFETPDELRQIDESVGEGFAVAAVTNGTTEVNGTGPAANGTGPGENVSDLADGNVSALDDGNASSPPETPLATGGNASAPTDGNASSPTETESKPSETGEGSTNESSGAGNSTAVSAPANAFDADLRPASDRSNGT